MDKAILSKIATLVESSNQRLLVDCCGNYEWCLNTVLEFSNKKTLLFSQNPDYPQAIPFNKSVHHLGRDYDVIFFDVFSGFHVEAFCRAIGLVKSPGLFFLLRPNDSTWINQKDEFNIWQDQIFGHSNFISYLLSSLEHPAIIHLHQQSPDLIVSKLPLSAATNINKESGLSSGQELINKRLHKFYSNNNLAAFALIAPRGRGKSTLLAYSINNHSNLNFALCSDSKKATAHCLNLINSFSRIKYYSIDHLLLKLPQIDCLIVDESAMIPIAQLRQLKNAYNKIIFSTTLDGYEGSGFGFKHKLINSYKLQEIEISSLSKPMRWGDNDLLDQWYQKVFLTQQQNIPIIDKQNIEYRLITQSEILKNINLLSQILQCLKSAHYRSKTNDLRQLLDCPNINLFIAQNESQIVGVLLLNQEGEINAELTQQIYLGKRRPHGHLLAQNLTAHARHKNFATHKGFRIQRIAVIESLRRRSIGSQLVALAVAYCKQSKADYLGTMFSLDHQRIQFWQNNNFKLVYVNSGEGVSTGSVSISMLQPLNKDLSLITTHLSTQFKDEFITRLMTQFKYLEAGDVYSILQLLPEFKKQDSSAIESFISGFSGFEHNLPGLQDFVLVLLQSNNSLNNLQIELLVLAILQYRSTPELIVKFNLTGKKQLLEHIKKALK